ncbi:MAG: pilus assembly protein CpaB [Acidimicrobiaceae bacterium]|nr:pilus assembly protein CpaB [Acidimicrobiaceae bacterium]
MHPLRRIRIAFATRRLLYWALVATLAVSAGWFVTSRAAALDRARHRLGTGRAVVVTNHPVATGDTLGPADVRVVEMPLAWAPPDAVASLPPGATATARMGVGEVITPARLGPSDRSPLAALVAADRRAVAVARGDHALPLRVGDRVDVVSALAVADGGEPRVVASQAPVVHVDDTTVVVAVTVDDEAPVAGAAAVGAATLTLAG